MTVLDCFIDKKQLYLAKNNTSHYKHEQLILP